MARVLYIPGVHRAWTEWVSECTPLLRLRAVSPNFNQAVQNAEMRGGDVLATLAGGQWLNFIAFVMSELEAEMWDTWKATRPHHHMSLWEWESNTHGGGTIWDEYDEIHGFPNDEAPDSLAAKMAREKQRREYPSNIRRYNNGRRPQQ